MWHPERHGTLLHSTTMNYDSKIGFLLLRLALFYHINDCCLIVEAWLASSRMGSKSLQDSIQSFHICTLSILLVLFNETYWSSFWVFPPRSLLSYNLPTELLHCVVKQARIQDFFHYLRGVTDTCVGRLCWFLHLLTTPAWMDVGSVIGQRWFLLIQHSPPQRASLLQCNCAQGPPWANQKTQQIKIIPAREQLP